MPSVVQFSLTARTVSDGIPPSARARTSNVSSTSAPSMFRWLTTSSMVFWMLRFTRVLSSVAAMRNVVFGLFLGAYVASTVSTVTLAPLSSV